MIVLSTSIPLEVKAKCDSRVCKTTSPHLLARPQNTKQYPNLVSLAEMRAKYETSLTIALTSINGIDRAELYSAI